MKLHYFKCERCGEMCELKRGYIRCGPSRYQDYKDGIAIFCWPCWSQQQWDELLAMAALHPGVVIRA